MPTLLAIDTATPHLLVGLCYQNKNFIHQSAPNIIHTDYILPAIDSIFTQAELSQKTVNAIIVGVGPGSFMGVRTAIATAQGLAIAWECPVIPVSSLAIIAQTAYQQNGRKKQAAVWDARMNQFYFGDYVYQAELDAMVLVGEERLIPADEGLEYATVIPEVSALLHLGMQKYLRHEVIAPEKLMANYVRHQVV